MRDQPSMPFFSLGLCLFALSACGPDFTGRWIGSLNETGLCASTGFRTHAVSWRGSRKMSSRLSRVAMKPLFFKW